MFVGVGATGGFRRDRRCGKEAEARMVGLRDRHDDADERLERYTDPAGHFAFATYDCLYGPDQALTPADVLMANLLSLRLGWQEVIPLFAEGDGPPQRLRRALDRALVDLADKPNFEDHNSVA